MSKPETLLPSMTHPEIIDPIKTGKAAKYYRVARRATLKEVAAKLTSPGGTKLSVANLYHYETGRHAWTADFLAAYKKAVDEISAAYTK